ncbi:MAG: tRNA (adenosine(37)-N6)-dimethylallyltransferase MiaA [Bacteroides sp.]
MNYLIALYGPTSVGKTALSIALANLWHCPIVSADSRQVYRELRIGVARPSPSELEAAEHHFIADRSVLQRFSCGQFEVEALQRLAEIFQRGHVAILTGGSMLYLDALTKGIAPLPEPDIALRKTLTARLNSEGVGALAAELRELDPTTWTCIDRQNGARVLRALEVTLQTGTPFSEWMELKPKPRPFTVVNVGLRREWPELTERIGLRVEQMLAEGLVEEVKGLLPYRELQPLKSVGYSEIFSYLDGLLTLQQATEAICVNTRRYAKRQMRWWQRDSSIAWFHPSQFREIAQYVDSRLV